MPPAIAATGTGARPVPVPPEDGGADATLEGAALPGPDVVSVTVTTTSARRAGEGGGMPGNGRCAGGE
ncbi:hypothetical protein BC834DRAFT_903457 [Gloeopeniophorella convolvens]|nr:hypothetical protein BC834DRAFT_903457 [Gloeopeniophorella convolvens]